MGFVLHLSSLLPYPVRRAESMESSFSCVLVRTILSYYGRW